MEVGVGINGTGRIGRLLIRRALTNHAEGLKLKAVNSLYPVETIAHLLKYDSVHGTWDADVAIQDGNLLINGNRIEFLSERDPALLRWHDRGITLAIDATGVFTDRAGASKHLTAGAHSVLITSPAKQADLTVVMGVNEHRYDPGQHRILSAASCTTNCVAALLHVLDRAFGVKQGWMTTVHSFTNDQNHMDNPHKDLRRARACGQSMIPTSTGVGKALADVLPHLAPVIQGISIRVPTPNVSLVDLTVQLTKQRTYEEVRQAFVDSSNTDLKPYLAVMNEPLVSSDFIGNEHSAVIDGPSLMVNKDQLKILAWYDNEWAYSCRVMDLAQLVGKSILIGGAQGWTQTAAIGS
ncbi:MAG: type I glyceraldehyde-3-phosphate dehydrogenase [Candidatus Pristimantibacillus sp.]